jgi:hypothetical protein
MDPKRLSADLIRTHSRSQSVGLQSQATVWFLEGAFAQPEAGACCRPKYPEVFARAEGRKLFIFLLSDAANFSDLLARPSIYFR